MPFAKVNGVNLYYQRHGETGEQLVFIHGYGRDMTDWAYQVAQFSPDFRVLTLDLRGHGSSEAPDRSAYSVEEMARDVQALAGVLGFERYHLVGHSLGGCIVQEVALSVPERLLSLTLEDTGPLGAVPDDLERQKFNAMQIELAQTKGMAAVVDLCHQYVGRFVFLQDMLGTDFDRLERMPVEALIGATLVGPKWIGTIDRALSIATPTLVICGELDAAPMVFASQWLAQTIPNARLEMVPRAGHSPQRVQTELYNRALRRHLQEHHS